MESYSCRGDVGIRQMVANTTKIENTLSRRIHHHTRKHLLRCYKDYSRLSELKLGGYSLGRDAERQWILMGGGQENPL